MHGQTANSIFASIAFEKNATAVHRQTAELTTLTKPLFGWNGLFLSRKLFREVRWGVHSQSLVNHEQKRPVHGVAMSTLVHRSDYFVQIFLKFTPELIKWWPVFSQWLFFLKSMIISGSWRSTIAYATLSSTSCSMAQASPEQSCTSSLNMWWRTQVGAFTNYLRKSLLPFRFWLAQWQMQ